MFSFAPTSLSIFFWQVNFCNFIVLPLWETVTDIFPNIAEMSHLIRHNKSRWEELQKAVEAGTQTSDDITLSGMETVLDAEQEAILEELSHLVPIGLYASLL